MENIKNFDDYERLFEDDEEEEEELEPEDDEEGTYEDLEELANGITEFIINKGYNISHKKTFRGDLMEPLEHHVSKKE